MEKAKEIAKSPKQIATSSLPFNVLELKQKLDKKVVGQEEAKIDVISALATNHMKVMLGEDPDKRNAYLLVGPTGSGKTLIVSTVTKFLNVPTEIVDSMKITVAGYVGANIEDCLVRLLEKANGNLELAQNGVIVFDVDIDVKAYCDKAQELYEKFCDCYTTEQVTAVIDDQLSRMQANKISVKGNLFFIPNQYLPLLDILEDYIESLAKYNLNDDCTIVCNSMHVVDSERQREKMAEEFYNNYKRDIEMYQKSIQKFIDSGGTSPTVIERWIKKINALNQKKSTYEDVLRQRLDNLDKDYALLKMQAQELIVRSNKSQISMPLAA